MSFEQSIVIAASPGELFALTQDYARRLEWDPFLRSAELVNGAVTAGVGVRAYCVARSGLGMETEYVSFNPPRATAVKMTQGPWFLRSFAGSWRFEEVAPGQTRVGFCYHLDAWPVWLSWLVTPLVGRVFAWDMRKRLRALKVAVEKRGLLPAKVVEVWALLPPAILATATLRGKEYAWPFARVEEAISAARSTGLATLGGQAQFRLPDGVCEMYWLDADAADRQGGEPWPDFVDRSAQEVLTRFKDKVVSADYLAEARQWPFLREKIENGINVLDYLCFVLYFQAEPGRTSNST